MRNSGHYGREAVVSILSAFKDKADLKGRDIEAVRKNDEAVRATLVADLPSGHSVFLLGGGGGHDAHTTSDWKPGTTLSSALSKSRTDSKSVYAIRTDVGECHAFVVVDNVRGRCVAVEYAQDDTERVPCPGALGRTLISQGVNLGAFMYVFGAFVDSDDCVHFVDDAPEKVDIRENASLSVADMAVLPKVLNAEGDFYLMDTRIARNTLSANVRGCLGYVNATGVVVPSHLNVGKDLLLQMSDADRLPDRFSVGRDLNIAMTRIVELPDQFNVGRNIIANGSLLERLRGGTTVKGDLDLRNCPIAELPWGMEVNGSLNLAGTAIRQVPGDLFVGGNLMIEEHVVVPPSVRLGGNLLVARPYGYDTGVRSLH